MATRFDALERHDPPDSRRSVERWRSAAFLVAAALWVPVSAVTCLLAFIGLFGVGSGHGETPGLVDDPTSASAIAALGVAVAAFALAFAVLLLLARWAWPGHHRRAILAAGVVVGWTPALGVVVIVLWTIGGG